MSTTAPHTSSSLEPQDQTKLQGTDKSQDKEIHTSAEDSTQTGNTVDQALLPKEESTNKTPDTPLEMSNSPLTEKHETPMGKSEQDQIHTQPPPHPSSPTTQADQTSTDSQQPLPSANSTSDASVPHTVNMESNMLGGLPVSNGSPLPDIPRRDTSSSWGAQNSWGSSDPKDTSASENTNNSLPFRFANTQQAQEFVHGMGGAPNDRSSQPPPPPRGPPPRNGRFDRPHPRERSSPPHRRGGWNRDGGAPPPRFGRRNWREFPQGSSAFIGNLQETASSEELKALFSRYAPVLEVTIKGLFGFVQFEDAEACERVVAITRNETYQGELLKPRVARRSEKRGGAGGFGGGDGHGFAHGDNPNQMAPGGFRNRPPPLHEGGPGYGSSGGGYRPDHPPGPGFGGMTSPGHPPPGYPSHPEARHEAQGGYDPAAPGPLGGRYGGPPPGPLGPAGDYPPRRPPPGAFPGAVSGYDPAGGPIQRSRSRSPGFQPYPPRYPASSPGGPGPADHGGFPPRMDPRTPYSPSHLHPAEAAGNPYRASPPAHYPGGGHPPPSSGYGVDRPPPGHYPPPGGVVGGGQHPDPTGVPPRMAVPPSAQESPFPRRYGKDVPFAQILFLDDVNRAFAQYIEEGLTRAGIHHAFASVSPHMPLQAIMKQLILEGVRGIFRLDRRHETSGLVSLQLFEATPPGSAPSLNVKYDEYENISLEDAINIISSARQVSTSTMHPPVPSASGSTFGGVGVGNGHPGQGPSVPAPVQAQAQGQTSAAAPVNGGAIDINAISALLGSLRPPPANQAVTPAPAAPTSSQTSSSSSMDASQLLAMLQGPPSNQ